MKVRTASLNYGRLMLYLAVVLVLNLALASVPALRLDLTERKVFTLSPATRETLKNLREPLTIRAYLSDNLPARFHTLATSLKDLLQIYAQTSGANFNFTINTIGSEDAAQDLVKEAQSYGIYQTNIQAVEKYEFKEVAVYLGLALIQGDSIERINPIRPETTLEYELTAAIQRMSRKSTAFLQLSQPVQVLFYFSPALVDLNPEWASMGDSYRRLIEGDLGPQFYGRLAFQQVDPASPPSGLPNAQELRLSELQVNQNGAQQPVYASLVLKNGEQTRAFNLMRKSLDLGSLLGGEQRYTVSLPDPASVKEGLVQSIEQMVEINRKISYVQDLGTPSLTSSPYEGQASASLNQFSAVASKSYDIRQVAIADGIPPETNVMILVNPGEKLNAWQLYQLDQYLMYGGALMLMVSPYRTVTMQQYGGQTMMVPNVNLVPGKDGEYTLADLLKHYGMAIKNSMLFDKQAYINRSENGGRYSEQTYYFLAELRNSNMNPQISYLNDLQFVIYQTGGALELDEKVATPLFWSSPKAWTQEINMQDSLLNVFPPQEDKLQRYPLVAIRRGGMTSFFAGKTQPARPVPEKTEGEEAKEPVLQQAERPFKEQSEQVALMVSGNGDLLADSVLTQVPDNVTLAVNLLNVISGDEAMANLRAKGNPLRYLDPNLSSRSKNAVVLVNLVVTPLLVGLLGAVAALVWSSRRRRIAAMFSVAAKEEA